MKLIVIAPRGKMGSSIVRISSEREDLELVSAVGTPDRDYIGSDLGEVSLLGKSLRVRLLSW